MFIMVMHMTEEQWQEREAKEKKRGQGWQWGGNFSANQKKEHFEDMLCGVYPYMNAPPLAADNKLKKIHLIDILSKESCLWLITRKNILLYESQ